MKHDINWHVDNLINSRKSEERLRRQISELNTKLETVKRNNDLNEAKIKKAQEKGLTEFDIDKMKAPQGGGE